MKTAMQKYHMCQYGNCEKISTPVLVTTKDERQRFCCDEHAALWLLRQCSKVAHDTACALLFETDIS
jgi:hypothetical protein